MIVFRFLAYLLILAGIGILGHGVVGMLENGGFEPVPFAKLWLWIDQSSLLGANHFLEQSLGADIQNSVLVPYFWGAAAYAVFLAPGILLWLVSRPRGYGPRD